MLTLCLLFVCSASGSWVVGPSLAANAHVGPVSVGVDTKHGTTTAVHAGPVVVEKGEHSDKPSYGVEVGVGPAVVSAMRHDDGSVTVGAGLGVHAGDLGGANVQVKYTMDPETVQHPFDEEARHAARVQKGIQVIKDATDVLQADSNALTRQFQQLKGEHERWAAATAERAAQFNRESAELNDKIEAWTWKNNNHGRTGRSGWAPPATVECCLVHSTQCTCYISDMGRARQLLIEMQDSFNRRVNDFKATNEREKNAYQARENDLIQQENALTQRRNNLQNYIAQLRNQM